VTEQFGGAVSSLPIDIRESAVQFAVDLCESAGSRGEQIPDRSQLNTLLRGAVGTPSAREALLFLRYQAARQPPKQRAFIERVARTVEAEPWGSDIDALRFFLGTLARACYVQSRSKEGSGHRG